MDARKLFTSVSKILEKEKGKEKNGCLMHPRPGSIRSAYSPDIFGTNTAMSTKQPHLPWKSNENQGQDGGGRKASTDVLKGRIARLEDAERGHFKTLVSCWGL